MKRVSSLLVVIACASLAACEDNRIENVQVEAENQSQRLEGRANEITAEAENSTSQAEQTLENQAAALLNQAEPADNVDVNQANIVE